MIQFCCSVVAALFLCFTQKRADILGFLYRCLLSSLCFISLWTHCEITTAFSNCSCLTAYVQSAYNLKIFPIVFEHPGNLKQAWRSMSIFRDVFKPAIKKINMMAKVLTSIKAFSLRTHIPQTISQFITTLITLAKGLLS